MPLLPRIRLKDQATVRMIDREVPSVGRCDQTQGAVLAGSGRHGICPARSTGPRARWLRRGQRPRWALVRSPADAVHGASTLEERCRGEEGLLQLEVEIVRPSLVASTEQLRHLRPNELGGRQEVAEHLGSNPMDLASDSEQ